MKNRIADQYQSAGRRAADRKNTFAANAQQQLVRARQAVEEFVAEHPAVCLGVAASVGIAIGWWVKRK